MAGNVDPNDVTDSHPIPRLAAPDQAPPVRLAAGESTCEGVMLSVTRDEIAVLVDEGLPVDSQVDLSSGAVTSIGVVIWSRSHRDDGKTVLGIEIMGGAREWEALLT